MSVIKDIRAALKGTATKEQLEGALAGLPSLVKLGQWGKENFVPVCSADPAGERTELTSEPRENTPGNTALASENSAGGEVEDTAVELPTKQGFNLTVAIASGGVLVVLLVVIGVVRTAVLEESKAEAATRSTEQLSLVTEAMLDYTRQHGGELPPAALVDGDGRPLLSWRVAILPHLGIQERDLYQQFHLDESWDSKHNRKLIKKIPDVFASATHSTLVIGHTTYLLVTGEATAFPSKSSQDARLPGSKSETTLVVDVPLERSQIWTRPAEHEYDATSPGSGLIDWDQKWIHLLTFDGKSHYLSVETPDNVLRSLLEVKAEKNNINWQEISLPQRSGEPDTSRPADK